MRRSRLFLTGATIVTEKAWNRIPPELGDELARIIDTLEKEDPTASSHRKRVVLTGGSGRLARE